MISGGKVAEVFGRQSGLYTSDLGRSGPVAADQLRLLQHGEILLDPPADLWDDVFGEPAPAAAPAQINRGELDQHLRQRLVQAWSHCRWQMQPLMSVETQDLEGELASGSEL